MLTSSLLFFTSLQWEYENDIEQSGAKHQGVVNLSVEMSDTEVVEVDDAINGDESANLGCCDDRSDDESVNGSVVSLSHV